MDQVRNETEMYLVSTSKEPITKEAFTAEYATRLRASIIEVDPSKAKFDELYASSNKVQSPNTIVDKIAALRGTFHERPSAPVKQTSIDVTLSKEGFSRQG